MKINLFVLGLTKEVTTIKILELFSLYGTVDSLHLPTYKNSGSTLGYGFVQMTEKTGAERAIAALDGTMFNGKKLSVRIADKKAKEPSRMQNYGSPHQNQDNQKIQRKMRPRRNRDQKPA